MLTLRPLHERDVGHRVQKIIARVASVKVVELEDRAHAIMRAAVTLLNPVAIARTVEIGASRSLSLGSWNGSSWPDRPGKSIANKRKR
jgi:hypothetical protein